MYLVDPVEADFHVLRGVDEAHQLLDGAVQLPDDVLDGEHHAQGHLPVDDGGGGQHGDQDVLHLGDEDAARLLRLSQLEALGLHAEKPRLHVLPFPTAALLAILQLDLLHGGDEPVGLVVVLRLLLEQLVVDPLAFPEEEGDPEAVEQASRHEDREDERVVNQQHAAEHEEGQQGEEHREGLVREVLLDPLMVAHALHQVAHQPGVEEAHGQPQQLDEEVGDERDVDAHADVQQDPPLDEVEGGLAGHQRQLPQQDQPDEAQVLVVDAQVDDGLRQEREKQLEEAADGKPQEDLPEIVPVTLEVAEQEGEGTPLRLPGHPFAEEGRGRLSEHGDPLVLAPRAGLDPSRLERRAVVLPQPLARVRDVVDGLPAPLAADPVEDDEMVLVPVQDGGQLDLGQLPGRQPAADGFQPQFGGGLADAEQRDPLAARPAEPVEVFGGILLAPIGADHPQAGDAALHGVVLTVQGKFSHGCDSLEIFDGS